MKRTALAGVLPIALVLGACGPPLATSTQPAASSAQPSPTAAAYRAWTERSMPIAVPGIFGGNSPNAVTRLGDVLVAVGGVNGGCCDASYSTDTQGLIWTSGDGLAWELVPSERAFQLGSLRAVAATSTAIVAVGTVNRESTTVRGEIDPRPAVWASEDARSWTRIEDVPAFVDIAAIGDRFVAAAQTPRGPEVWVSIDGRSWSRFADAATLGGGEVRRVIGMKGGMVLLGSQVHAAGPAIWQYRDGSGWARATDAIAATGVSSVEDAVVAGTRVVAIGSDEGGSSAVLVSESPSEWRRLDGVPLAPGEQAARLIPGPQGLLAIGTLSPEQSDTPAAAAWSSPSGLTWSRVEPSTAMRDIGEITGGVTLGDGVVLVGRGTSRDPTETYLPAAWLIH